MTASNKFIKHFRDLQAGESEKAGAAETLAYLNGLYSSHNSKPILLFSFQANYLFKSTKNVSVK
jgi:hypothetical protein